MIPRARDCGIYVFRKRKRYPTPKFWFQKELTCVAWVTDALVLWGELNLCALAPGNSSFAPWQAPAIPEMISEFLHTLVSHESDNIIAGMLKMLNSLLYSHTLHMCDACVRLQVETHSSVPGRWAGNWWPSGCVWTLVQKLSRSGQLRRLERVVYPSPISPLSDKELRGKEHSLEPLLLMSLDCNSAFPATLATGNCSPKKSYVSKFWRRKCWQLLPLLALPAASMRLTPKNADLNRRKGPNPDASENLSMSSKWILLSEIQ